MIRSSRIKIRKGPLTQNGSSHSCFADRVLKGSARCRSALLPNGNQRLLLIAGRDTAGNAVARFDEHHRVARLLDSDGATSAEARLVVRSRSDSKSRGCSAMLLRQPFYEPILLFVRINTFVIDGCRLDSAGRMLRTCCPSRRASAISGDQALPCVAAAGYAGATAARLVEPRSLLTPCCSIGVDGWLELLLPPPEEGI